VTNEILALPATAAATAIEDRVRLLDTAYRFISSDQEGVMALAAERRRALAQAFPAPPNRPAAPSTVDPLEALHRLVDSTTFSKAEYDQCLRLAAALDDSAEAHYLLSCAALRCFGLQQPPEAQWFVHLSAAIHADPTHPVYVGLLDETIGLLRGRGATALEALRRERNRLSTLLDGN
jgi:hypothetical protein